MFKGLGGISANYGNRPFLYLPRIRRLFPDWMKTTIHSLPMMSGRLLKLR